MPVQASPVPLGDPNHFAFIFPIRPCPSKEDAAADARCGETRFQITYRLPYNGSLKFSRRLTMPTDAVMVMVPKSMKFDAASGSTPYQAVTEDTSAQTFVARKVAPSQTADFTVSGTGQLPRDTQAAAAGENGGTADASGQPAAGSAATDKRPGGGLGTPLDPEGNNDPWAKYKWWILGGLGLAMAAGAGFMMSNNPQKAGAVPVAVRGVDVTEPSAFSAGGDSLLAAMKEELFTLETDKLQGRLSEQEYQEQKAALEVVLRRALVRGERGIDASNISGPAI